MSDRLIELDGVDFAYNAHRPVLAGCSFELAAGQRIGLHGPNGSGKTTLLRLIVGLLRPSRGQLLIFGTPRIREADFHEVRRRVGLVFQDTDDQLFCPTVGEDVAFGPLNLGLPNPEVRRRVAQSLDALGLAGYEDRVTHRLSGGEKRLVALITVLAMQPDVLLLDEPNGQLDEESLYRLIGILNGLPQAMLIVSHDRDFLKQTTSQRLRLAGCRLEDVDY